MPRDGADTRSDAQEAAEHAAKEARRNGCGAASGKAEEEMTGYQFRLDTSPFDAALAEMVELLARQPESSPYRTDAADLFSVIEQCFTMVPNVRPAGGALESVTTFQPSERLLELLVALRALDRDLKIVA